MNIFKKHLTFCLLLLIACSSIIYSQSSKRIIPSLTQQEITFLKSQGLEQEIIALLVKLPPFLQQFIDALPAQEYKNFWKEFDEVNNLPAVLITYFLIFDNLSQANPELGWEAFITESQQTITP